MSIVAVVALVVAPLRVSARTCIIYDTQNQKACHMDCCANKTCCATSHKNTAPTSQPLAKSDSAHELAATCPPVIAAVLPIASHHQQVVQLCLGHSPNSPPQLAVLCTFLI
jgi:hypothetical protein